MFLELHNRLNPTHLAPVNSEEIASIDMYLDGSIINHKGGGTIQVAETPEAIYEMIKEKQ
jgi:hypothetical protein